MRKGVYYFITFILVLGTNCAVLRPPTAPSAWHRALRPTYGIPPYARYLHGMKFCLDPGHGGLAHLRGYKRGPTGVREAVMNLHLANYLKGFLEGAGAVVYLTRDDDYFISLADRAKMANDRKVDFFISIHHNASSSPKTNFTSTWYHADADYSPVSLDLARYVQQGVVEMLRLPQFPPTGLYSDQLMYPAGFGVLRRLEVPGILVEGSFFSNPKEEKRLKKKKYLKKEAYGYFMGIARYVAAGIPTAELIFPEPESSIPQKSPTIRIRVNDGIHERGAWILERQQFFTHTFDLLLDGRSVPYLYDPETSTLRYKPDFMLLNGEHWIEVLGTNYYGNHIYPRKTRFRVAPPPDTLIITRWFDPVPANGECYVGIRVQALDADSLPVADGDTVFATTTYGVLERDQRLTRDGEVNFYLHSEPREGLARMITSLKGRKDSVEVGFLLPGTNLLQGRVEDGLTSGPVEGAGVWLGGPDTLKTATDGEGHFYFTDVKPGLYDMLVRQDGYYNSHQALTLGPDLARVTNPSLDPVAGGALQGLLLVIDPRYGGSELGAVLNDTISGADLNLMVAQYLFDFLKKAGADPVLLRDRNIYMGVEARIDSANALAAEGYYLRIDHGQWKEGLPTLQGLFYPGNVAGERLLNFILKSLRQQMPDTTFGQHQSAEETEMRDIKYSTITVGMNTIGHRGLMADPADPVFLQWEAYAIFNGILSYFAGEGVPPYGITVEVKEAETGDVLAGAEVDLDGAISLFTDIEGKVHFQFLPRRVYRIGVRAVGYVPTEEDVDVFQQKKLEIFLTKKE